MSQVFLQSQLSLVTVVQELITLVDQDQVLLAHLDLSCQPLVVTVPTNPINTQEELVDLELVEMLTCTVAVAQHMEELMVVEDIVSSVDVLLEVILVVEIIHEIIKDVQHLAQVERMDGSDLT